MTQLSKNIITHKLKIKGEGIKYIGKETAEIIFKQLTDPNTKTVTISNPSKLTYVQKYKQDIELYELGEEKDLEDRMYMKGLSEAQRDHFRNVWNQRKKENKSTSDTVMENMIDSYIKNGII